MICKQLVAVAVAVAVAVVAAVAVEVRTLVVPSVVTSDLATSFLLSKDTIIRREQFETIKSNISRYCSLKFSHI